MAKNQRKLLVSLGRGAGKLPNFQCADNNEVFRALLFSLRRKVILPSESWNLRWYLAISFKSKCRPDPAAPTAIIEVPVRTSSFEFRSRWLICLPPYAPGSRARASAIGLTRKI
jgi:hypothetical protein